MYVVENVFRGQSIQRAEPLPENEPALHAAHVIGVEAPSTLDAVPAVQLTQTLDWLVVPV
jgi:hypothetical protein